MRDAGGVRQSPGALREAEKGELEGWEPAGVEVGGGWEGCMKARGGVAGVERAPRGVRHGEEPEGGGVRGSGAVGGGGRAVPDPGLSAQPGGGGSRGRSWPRSRRRSGRRTPSTPSSSGTPRPSATRGKPSW